MAIYQELDDQAGIAQSLNNLGLMAAEQSDYVKALALHEQSLGISKALGNEWGIANSLHSIGLISYYLSDLQHPESSPRCNV